MLHSKSKEKSLEIIALLAVAIILWMLWQLHRARQFNRFKQFIETELRQKVVSHLKNELNEQRSERFPNNEAHIAASEYYWSQYPSRILQAALHWKIIEKDWLEKTGNKRHCQHLFFIERDKMAHFVEPTLKVDHTGNK